MKRILVTYVVLGLISATGAQTTFFDGTFNNADWELVTEVYGNGGIVNVSQGIEGNPGEYRRIVNRVYGAPSACLGFHKCKNALYNPQTQGAIASIDYSEDSIMFSGFGEGQATAPALLQDGLIYYYHPYLSCNTQSWTTQSLQSLSEEDFSRPPWTGSTRHPDFSSSGNPIAFGFWRGNSSRYSTNGYTIVGGIDNWSITITSSDNEGPLTFNMDAAPNPVVVNSSCTLTANLDDSTTGGSNIAEADYSLDGMNWYAMDAQDGAFDSVSEDVTATFTAPASAGIYGIAVFGTDVVPNLGDPEVIMLVVYDPSGGFVTGGGWIDSSAGAYKLDETLTGKANFGFVSKYKKGADTPSGNTKFVFQTADLNFHSSSYDWLVVTGSDFAKFKGWGSLNGEDGYRFMLWSGDGEPDTFRIKIWEEINEVEHVVYDNGFDQAISGGSIVIHTKE